MTPERVKALLRHIDAGGGSNGVGLAQLTWPPYIREAESLGGAHRARFQCRVGFEVLADNINRLGYEAGIGAYNAGPANWRSVYDSYIVPVAQKHREWLERLNGLPTGLEPTKPEPPEPKPPEPEEPVMPEKPTCHERLKSCRKERDNLKARVEGQVETIVQLRAENTELREKLEEGDDMPDKPTVDPGPIEPKPPVFPEKPTKEPLNIGKYAKAIFALLIPLITTLITGYGADEFDWQEIAELAGAAVTGIIVYLVPNVEK